MIRISWWDPDDHRKEAPTGSGLDISVARGLNAASEALSGIDVLIAEVHDIRREETREPLLRYLQLPARPPVLLLTSQTWENARFLVDLPVDALAWLSDLEEEVVARGARLAKVTERRRVAEFLLNSISGGESLERVIREALACREPISRVRDLARRCFLSQRALERKWKEARPKNSSATLKALVDWALLLRAWEMCQRGIPPQELPNALGIHERTLARLADRLSGLPCAEFFELERGRVRQMVDRELSGQGRKKSRFA